MSKQLPPNPNIDVLRKEARHLLRAFHSGDAEATRSVEAHAEPLPPSSTSFSLRHAQLVVARQHGFTRWQALRESSTLLDRELVGLR